MIIELLFLSFSFIFICYSDCKKRKIPNRLILILLLVEICLLPIRERPLHHLVGFLLPSLPLLIITYLIPAFIGAGDIKLYMVTGLILGYKINVFLFAGAALLSLAYIIFSFFQYKTLKNSIPFALPTCFLCIITYICNIIYI